jgi:hypothetical protein
MMRRRSAVLAAIVVVAAVWLGTPLAGQGGEKYTARLGWVPITAAERSGVTGKGSVTATLAGTKLSITGAFEGLASSATVARLHRGVAKGARGMAITDLTITKATSGMITGSVNLEAADVENLKQGKLYVQVHSEKGVAPDGANLWGWLMK